MKMRSSGQFECVEKRSKRPDENRLIGNLENKLKKPESRTWDVIEIRFIIHLGPVRSSAGIRDRPSYGVAQ